MMLLSTIAVAPEGSADLRPVLIDWSAVSDATVQRCGLGLLQSLLLQGMVESGFAVVDASVPRVITVTLRERKAVVVVEARRDDVVALRRVPVPQRCDSTIGVDLQAAARSTAREVEDQTPQAPVAAAPDNVVAANPAWTQPAPTVIAHTEPPPPRSERSFSGPRGRLGLGALMSRADSPFAVGAVQVGTRLGHWGIAGSFDAALRVSHGVTVVEPALGPELSYIIALPGVDIGIGAEVKLLGHAYWYDGASGGHLDVRFGVPIRVEHVGSGVGFSLTGWTRLRPVEHTVGEENAYRIGHVGAALVLTFRVPP